MTIARRSPPSRLRQALAVVALLTVLSPAAARALDLADWNAILAAARGQTVYFNAWGGEPRINAYIEWAGRRVGELHGVRVEHVRLGDTAEAVTRVLAEKTAGRNSGGTVDLIWINGENFAAMKRSDLLFGPWSERLPNFRFVDVAKPNLRFDFGIPVDGLEAPWAMAQLVLLHESARVAQAPASARALLDWARANPGRYTYPQVPNFLGTTFLKQILLERAADPSRLAAPTGDDFATVTAPLWQHLDELHPLLWRQGRAFPRNAAAQRTLMADGEIDLALSFNPLEAAAAVDSGELPASVRTSGFAAGTIANASFLAIPWNAAHKEGALVLVDFLLSPEAQARKLSPSVWGSLPVLDVAALPAEQRRLFDVAFGPAALPPERLPPALAEPHPSWTVEIEREWLRRYGARP